ncbi:hypothetical protein ACTM9V_14775 [Oliverpabstia intestinalis]|uniref:hypothetical protein n=1 Tax=Oliverpabstia intestinalis TaxID=2606633 RepID=UPI003F88F641
MIFGSRKVNELYQRYCRQVLKILRSPSYDLTGEECREIWDEIWKEAMRRNRELRKLKNEEEGQSWILAIVKRKLEERKPKDKKSQIMRQKKKELW